MKGETGMPRRGAEPGAEWWSGRWLAALERAGWTSRMERGRSYARAGRVLDLRVESGRLTARVQGSGRQPYEVELQVLPLAPTVWRAVAARLVQRAGDAAELLAGRLPVTVEGAFTALGARLFPDEILAECTCPDWATPCKHVAATCYAFAAQLDADPFLLFRLRGRTRERFLAELERTDSAGAAPALAAGGERPEAVLPAEFWAPRPAALSAAMAAGAPLGLPGALPEPDWWAGPRPLREMLEAVYGAVERACAAAAGANAPPPEA